MKRARFLALAGFLVSISTALSFFSPNHHGGVPSLAPRPLAAVGAPGRPATILSPAGKRRVLEAFAKLPLYFESNAGQADASVKFLSRGPGYGLFLAATGAWFSLKGAQGTPVAFRMQLDGANPAAPIAGSDEQAGKINYFIGNDPRQWRTNVPTYRKVEYEGVYPGVDLVYYGNQQQLEYDFVVAPGADPRAIHMSFTGAERVEISEQGDLKIHTGGAEVLYRKPQVYQPEPGSAGGRKTVQGRFVLAGENTVAFEVGAYDAAQPLVIDPPMVFFSTFLGSAGDDGITGIAVDGNGNIYATGGTTSAANALFPTTGAAQTTYGGTEPSCNQSPTFGCGDAFIAKITPTGSALTYFTYLGGNDADLAYGLAVDTGGNAYVSGWTKSSNFPLMNEYPSTVSAGQKHAFVSKVNSTGSALLYSTLLGGNGQEQAVFLALDATDDVYTVGETSSTNFPTTSGVVQPTCNSCSLATPQTDAFVVKLNTTQTGTASLLFGTYLGGSGADGASGVAVDATGVYVVGSTTSTDLKMVPNPNPIQPGGFAGGGTGCATSHSIVCGDAFVAKMNIFGSSLTYLTYLGGSGEDTATEIVVDSQGNAYVSGGTDTDNATATTKFPITAGAYQTTFGGGSAGCTTTGVACGDAFLAKINPQGNALVYSTYVGGNGDDLGFGVQVDTVGNAYLTGVTNSTNLATTANALQPTFGGGTALGNCVNGQFCGDGFLLILDPTGTVPLFLTYSGSTGDDAGFGLALGAGANNGVLYASGFTNSTTFPTTPNVLQGTYGGGADDGFVAKFQIFSATTCTNTFTGGTGPAPSTDWGTAANWSTGLLPDASDNVCLGTLNVTVAGALPAGNQVVSSITATGGTLTLSGGSLSILNSLGTASSIGNLVVNGGTLTAGADLTVNGTLNLSSGTITYLSTPSSPVVVSVTGMMTWSGGTISGTANSSGTLLGNFEASGGLAITGTPVLNQADLLNCGAGTLSGPATVLTLSGGADFFNGNGFDCAAGTVDLMDSLGLAGASGEAGVGIWNKSGAGTSTIAPLFALNFAGDSVNVTNGTLVFNQVLSTTVPWNVSAGATLEFTGEAGFGGGSTISGAGTVSFVGSLGLSTTYNVTGATTFAGSSTTNLGGTLTNLGAVTMSAGTVSIASNTIGTIASLNQTGGTLFLTTETGAITSLGPMTVSGGTLNFSLAAATTATSLSVSGAGTVAQVGSSTTLNLGGLTLTGGAVAGPGTVNVSGTFTWSGGTLGTGAAGGSGGVLNLNGTSALSGSLSGISGLVITNAGTLTMSGAGTSLTTNTTITNTAAGTWDLQDSAGVSEGAFNNAGTLKKSVAGTVTTNFNTVLTNTGMLLAQAGTLSLQGAALGTGSSSGTISISAGATLQIGGSTGVTFTDTGNMTGAGTLQVSSATAAPAELVFSTGATGSLTTTLIGNNGQVDVQSLVSVGLGTVTLNGTGTGATPTLLFGEGTVAGNVVNMAGQVFGGHSITPGRLTIGGNYTQGAAGVLNTFISGLTAGTQYGQVNVLGIVSLNGTITGTLVSPFVPAVGNSIMPLNLVDTLSGTFSTNTIQAPSGDIWNLTYNPYNPATGMGNVTATLAASAPPNFTISAMPSSQTVIAGTGVDYTVSVTPANGFNSNVVLSVSGLPTGATSGFTPSNTITGGTGSAMLTVSTATTTPPGTYPITITGMGGGLTNTFVATLIVTAAPNFTISAMPSTVTVAASTGADYNVTVAALNGFNSNVVLSVSGLPTGATPGFTPNPIIGGMGTATLTISTTASTPPGTYPITITGMGGGLTNTASATLIVTGAPDFMLSVTPATQTVQANFGTSFSVMVTPVNGFAATVTATASGLPTGATSTPAVVTGGSGSAVLSISTSFSTPAGTYPLTITGTTPAGTETHTASVTLVVTAPKVVLSALTLAFSSTGVGKPSPVVSVTLTNAGTAPLVLDNVAVIAGTGTNPQPGDFTQASGTTCFGDGSTVGFTPPNNTCVVNLIFTPSGTALETAVLQFVDSATGSPQNVTLTGSIGAPFTLIVTSTNGGPGNIISLQPGDKGTYTLVLTPTALPIGTTVTLTCPALGTSLPPSTICLLNGVAVLTITVTSPGPITIIVTIQTNCLNALSAPRAPGNGPWPDGLPASFASVWLAAFLLAAGMRRYLPQRWARQMAPVCVALVLVLLVMTWTACVSNPPPALPNQPTTPAGVYPITVAATVPGISPVTVVLTLHVI